MFSLAKKCSVYYKIFVCEQVYAGTHLIYITIKAEGSAANALIKYMYTLDYKKYAKAIRSAVAESVVLLKNDKGTLPIKQDEKLAIFGRAQIDTYYCGTGSGGMVNIPYLVNIANGLKAKRKIDEELFMLYENFVAENPFDKGKGWAQEPFMQKELLLDVNTVKKARENSGTAVFVIGRSAGEDKDCAPEGGSYYLSEIEEKNMELVCNTFEKVVIMLNIGGVMDMSFVEKLNPSAVLIAWHGGIESGNGYADVMCGDVNASGCMPDTVAKKLEDYPSSNNFGGEKENIYAEDIFVGYRYFETFAEEKVLYPFGFGLSYTSFEIENTHLIIENDNYSFNLNVKNTGDKVGKKAVQIYVQAPVLNLGKAKKVLCGFAKTNELKPNEMQNITVQISKKDMASFDDNMSVFVLEKGEYKFYVGFDVRSAVHVAQFTVQDDEIIEKCTPALMPIKPFEKMASMCKDGVYKLSYNSAVVRGYDINERINEKTPKAQQKTNNNYTFEDVKNGAITVKQLANDLTDLELIQMSRGEGMCSPKVTPGTAGCYGGVSTSLKEMRKMPIACCSDGPSGIRMDCGTMAYSLPNATAIASTFNVKVVEELFTYLSLEMLHHKADTLLGPGMNIHRNPLCGRNFEYYSEDPFLTGKMATAQILTMNKHNVTGTIKHFAANNQEKARKTVDAVVSARALREIYLKGFEMAVKEGKAFSLMTAYNPINGTQAASNFDLNTTILRGDWGFDGIVMTDWWATMNKENGASSESYTADMITSQNDVFMVCASSEENSNADNSEAELANGNLTRGALVRNAENIMGTLLKYNCSKGYADVEILNIPKTANVKINDVGTYTIDALTSIDCTKIDTTKGVSNNLVLNLSSKGVYEIAFDLFADAPQLAQLPLTVKANGSIVKVITLKGMKKGVFTCEIDMFATINTYVELYFGESGMVINSIEIKRIKQY